jgi:hypothetical protein
MSSPTRVLPFRRAVARPVRAESQAWIEDTRRSLVALADQPVRVAFVRRAIAEALAYAEQEEDVLLEALASPAPANPLLRAEADPGPGPRGHARWAEAVERGRFAFRALLEAEGGTLPAEEAAARLGLSRQAVYLRQKKGKLLAVAGERGAVYPAFQFGERGTLPGLEPVLDALAGVAPAMAVQFFLSAQDVLGGERPLDALRAGRVERVRDAAVEFGSER